MKKVLKGILGLGLVLGVFATGYLSGVQVERVDLSTKKVVASQVAKDGSIQITFEDGTGYYFEGK